VATRFEFSDRLAHLIEAGADIFLMPSRYEPCGLTQLYSLKYGAVPVVHETGGLADTIADANPENLSAGKANGFTFSRAEAAALEEALRRACDAYHNQPQVWDQLVRTGMEQDWSWNRSARKYVQLYEDTVARVRQAVCA
jgi:starch synthase